eukprot:UN21186
MKNVKEKKLFLRDDVFPENRFFHSSKTSFPRNQLFRRKTVVSRLVRGNKKV